MDRENLVSLRQMAIIDDGSISSYKKMNLAEVGIGIEHGSILQNLTTGYETVRTSEQMETQTYL